MWRRILALMVKEFLALLKDKRGRTVLIIPPIVQLVVFGYAATYDLNNVPFAVYNEDTGVAGRDVVARLEGSPTFELVARLENDTEIVPLVNARQALMVVRIGPQFTSDLLQGRTAKIQIIVDGRDSNTAMLVLGYVGQIVAGFNQSWAEARGQQSAPGARLVTRAWFNPSLESRLFIIPGIVGLLTLVVTILVTALSVAREREAGTFDQLLVTPLRPVEILLGKALPGMIIGILEATFIIIMAIYWFEVPLRGNLAALYAGLVLFLLSAIGVGLMISSVAITQQQGLLGAFLFLVPAIILSGFATPIANMPPLMQDLTLLNPLRYLLEILRGVFLEGASMSTLWPKYWPMALIGLVNLGLAGWLFRHRMY
jgi:ABC-2 type transport system permease protein